MARDWNVHDARILARRVAFGDLVSVMVSVYLEHSVRLTGANVDLLGDLQEFLNSLSEPFIVGADWDMGPSMLEGPWWPRAVGGAALAPKLPTRGPHAYDYFAMPVSLAGLGPRIEVLRPTTLRPRAGQRRA